MSSEKANVASDVVEDKNEIIPATVRLSTDDEKLIRRAAVEDNKSRSEFMALASVEKARAVLGQRRSADAA